MGGLVARCLNSILKQKYLGKTEVLIIEGVLISFLQDLKKKNGLHRKIRKIKDKSYENPDKNVLWSNKSKIIKFSFQVYCPGV